VRAGRPWNMRVSKRMPATNPIQPSPSRKSGLISARTLSLRMPTLPLRASIPSRTNGKPAVIT
jgi:hypothetical protein